jgi:ArsR family transcriptional regulator
MDDNNLYQQLDYVARNLKVLAHPTRLLILQVLGGGERSVQELEKLVGASQSSVSQHLNLLRDREMLAARRAAQQVFYRLKEPDLLHFLDLGRKLFAPGAE